MNDKMQEEAGARLDLDDPIWRFVLASYGAPGTALAFGCRTGIPKI
ncbi:MAG: hypothetical protein M9895_02230 [Aquamicrobium sp.]|nr:hypothetical protein [Aquamicrobium sp.]